MAYHGNGTPISHQVSVGSSGIEQAGRSHEGQGQQPDGYHVDCNTTSDGDADAATDATPKTIPLTDPLLRLPKGPLLDTSFASQGSLKRLGALDEFLEIRLFGV